MIPTRQTLPPCLSMRDLVPGNHAVAFIESLEDQVDLVAGFLSDGIDKGGKAVFVTETLPAQELLHKLRQQGRPVDDLLARGQLEILDSDSTYLEGGYFSAARMAEKLGALIEQTAKDGWSHLCLAGEASWALRPVAGVEELETYEAEAQAIISQSNCVALCLYDVWLFGNRLHGSLLASHSHVVLGSELFDVLK